MGQTPIEVRSQLRRWKVPSASLERLLRWQLKKLGRPNAGLSLLLCGDTVSRRLNAKYRRRDRATDILSFPSMEGKVAPGSNALLGDLALNLPYAWRKRGRFYDRFSQEVSFLLLHGTAHLLGYHHDNAVQESAMDRLMRRAMPLPKSMDLALRRLKPQ